MFWEKNIKRQRLEQKYTTLLSKAISANSLEHFAKLPSEEETQRSVQIFKAFGDYTRYKILYLLYERELSVSEITSEIGVSQSAISHQLKLLRQTGLVSGRRDGQRILYSLADKHIIMIFKQVKEHISEDDI